MRYEISGTIMQTVAIDLSPGEVVYSQTNTMAWMNDAVEMDTHTGGGLFAGLKRSFAGGSFFVTDFTARGAGHDEPLGLGLVAMGLTPSVGVALPIAFGTGGASTQVPQLTNDSDCHTGCRHPPHGEQGL